MYTLDIWPSNFMTRQGNHKYPLGILVLFIHHCLHLLQLTVTLTTIENLNVATMTPFSEVYHNLLEVLCKTKACNLLPHRPYDFAIYLLSRAMHPCNWFSSLSFNEQDI